MKSAHALRKSACDEALKQTLINSAQQGGQDVPTKFRAAVDSDKYIIGHSVLVPADAVKDGDEILFAARQLKMLWQVSGKALWFELTTDSLEFVLSGIKHSPVLPPKAKAKGSPKKRRRRLRRHKSGQSQEANGEEEEAVAAETRE